MKNMLDETFVPRDQNGFIIPMVGPGGTDLSGNPLYYPIIPSRADGPIEPMLFAEDFEPGGKFYGKVTYAPGFYNGPLGMDESGRCHTFDFSKIVYTEPEHQLQALSQNCTSLPEGARPAAGELSNALARQGITPSVDIESRSELYLRDGNGQPRRICNCLVQVERLVRRVRQGTGSFSIALKLTRQKPFRKATHHCILVEQDDLDSLGDVIREHCPWFTLAAETRNAGALLSEFVRDQLDGVPCGSVLYDPGWQIVNGQRMFVHNGLDAGENILVDADREFFCEPGISPAEAFKNALRLADVGNWAVTVPLLLNALLGPLFSLFKDAGVSPGFVVFLHGVSGSLKSSLAKVLYNCFKNTRFNTFRDTAAAIDVSIGEHRDQMLLVDDFQPAVSAADGSAMRKTLEHLIRLFGDEIGKKRSNSRANATYGSRAHGSCLITGESLAGSYSSLLRCVQVHIARGDIDGEKLRVYQDNPALWGSNYAPMLAWVGKNWEQLKGRVARTFHQKRAELAAVTKELRLIDAGSVLITVADVFLEYGLACGGLDYNTRVIYMDQWTAIIAELIQVSDNTASGEDVVNIVQSALANAQLTGALKIAPSMEDFVVGEDGFLAGGKLWLDRSAFHRAFAQYCRNLQITCVQGDAVLAELCAKGLLVRDEETGKNSYLKRSGVIPALGKRLRMLAFELAVLDQVKE